MQEPSTARMYQRRRYFIVAPREVQGPKQFAKAKAVDFTLCGALIKDIKQDLAFYAVLEGEDAHFLRFEAALEDAGCSITPVEEENMPEDCVLEQYVGKHVPMQSDSAAWAAECALPLDPIADMRQHPGVAAAATADDVAHREQVTAGSIDLEQLSSLTSRSRKSREAEARELRVLQELIQETRKRTVEAQKLREYWTQRADEAKQRADEAKQRADEAKQRADEAKQRADRAEAERAEAERAEAERAEAERAEAELRKQDRRRCSIM